MRVTQDDKANWVYFVDDVEGGTLVQTKSGSQFIPTTKPGEPEYDPVTREEIFYPGWCEW